MRQSNANPNANHVIQPKFWSDQSPVATGLQLMLLIGLVVALVFCLAAIGQFSKEYNKTKKEADQYICFIFIPNPETADKPLPDNSYCQFVISGHGFVALFLLAMLILLALIAFVRLKVDVIIPIILVGVAIITLLLSLATSAVLSAGFSKTCSSFKKATSYSCSDLSGSLYQTLANSTAFSWIETISLCVVCMAAVLYLVLGALKRRAGYTSLT